MLNEAIAIKPPEKTEDRPSSTSSKKSTISNSENKIKSKIPITRSGRNAQGDSTNPTCEESSSGISSNNNSARRPTLKALNMSPFNRKPMNTGSAEKRQLEVQYSSKKIRYANLKKTLVDKQKIAQELYDEMSSLREKIIAVGGKDPGKIEELKAAQVECPKQSPAESTKTGSQHDCLDEECKRICMDEAAVIGVSLLQNQLQDLCDRSQELCQRVLDKSSSFASLVKSWLTEFNRQNENCMLFSADFMKADAQLATIKQENEELRTQLDELRTAQKDFVAEFTKRSSSLRDEYDNYHERVKDKQPNVDRKDLEEQLNVALGELKTERNKANQWKEGTRMLERQMQKAQIKIRDMELCVTNTEASSQQLQNSVKSLQAQLKQKDQMMEQRIKDMHKAMKSSEGLLAKIEKQRDSFESRIVDLKENMARKEAEANATIKELSEKFQAIDVEMSEERERRQQAVSALTEMEERYKHLEEKSQLLCDLANEKSNNLAVTDDNHTENEICLYNDLKATRAELEKHKQKIEQLEREKQEIVAVMHQAASDNDDETKDKLAAELIAKTNNLQNLMVEHAQLQKVARFTQERNEILENQLFEVQRLHATENDKTGPDTIELQQQVSDLRNSLAEVMQQNEALESTLTQKQLELEQRDRVMREQSKFLKARDELLDLLKGKQANADNSVSANYEDIDEINKQIVAKTEAIQELYATLENKQMQVMRLEKLVKLLEDQQDRAQAQRTRLEHRIAQLEVSLREKNKSDSNRYVMRKYLRTPRSDIIDDKLPRAFSCDSRRAFYHVNSHSREKSREFSRYENVSPAKSASSPSRKFYINDEHSRVFAGKKKVFTCKQCRREIDGKFRGDIIRHVKEHRVPIRRSLYGWLMDCSALEAFGEPTNSLNKVYNRFNSSDEDADCFFRIVDPFLIHDRSRESRRRRDRHFSKRSLHDASPR